jgi:hypothetical protein
MFKLTVTPSSKNLEAKSLYSCNVNASDINLLNLSKTIVAKWAQSPWLTLQWLTAAEFAKKISKYNDILEFRLKNGRTGSQAVTIIEKKIIKAVTVVRRYIFEKYKYEASKSYYPSFGISSKAPYGLLKDSGKLTKSLKLMINAIDKNGFADKEYGTAYWTAIKNEYDQLIHDQATTNRVVMKNQNDKHKIKEEIKEVLSAIEAIIVINYPNTCNKELSNWGIKRRKY